MESTPTIDIQMTTVPIVAKSRKLKSKLYCVASKKNHWQVWTLNPFIAFWYKLVRIFEREKPMEFYHSAAVEEELTKALIKEIEGSRND